MSDEMVVCYEEGLVTNTIMDRLTSSPRLMIVLDLDHTMNLSILRFNALWEAKYHHDSLLVFSTMSLITYGNDMVPDEGWVEFLNKKWDKKIVSEETSKFSELTLQSETELRQHKPSFHVEKEKAQEVMKTLSERLANRGIKRLIAIKFSKYNCCGLHNFVADQQAAADKLVCC
ncbi:hypothetical protein L1987_30141 [Smallanthus sonchifolius]|uniref:Uncharacterized protein n=1 Tax=Smallanthus sonchifolius TaxID=185202 RepID=A0ACB9I1W9_9ASTR|nr:hypothetical protein L1987_30141 [Smallanthus sonchifolius]